MDDNQDVHGAAAGGNYGDFPQRQIADDEQVAFLMQAQGAADAAIGHRDFNNMGTFGNGVQGHRVHFQDHSGEVSGRGGQSAAEVEPSEQQMIEDEEEGDDVHDLQGEVLN